MKPSNKNTNTKHTLNQKHTATGGKKNEEDHQEDRIKEGFISRRNNLRNRNHLHPRRSNPFQLHPHLQKRNRRFRRNLITKRQKTTIHNYPTSRSPGTSNPGPFSLSCYMRLQCPKVYLFWQSEIPLRILAGKPGRNLGTRRQKRMELFALQERCCHAYLTRLVY